MTRLSNVSLSTLSLLLLLLLFSGISWIHIITSSHIDYYNFKVLRIRISHLNLLNTINNLYMSEPENYDIWSLPRTGNNSMYISLSPNGYENLIELLKNLMFHMKL
ncbi:unnamed protein product [Heterobilharzia americana]|nr:unnamed protein product [Heterobilharzia americana]